MERGFEKLIGRSRKKVEEEATYSGVYFTCIGLLVEIERVGVDRVLTDLKRLCEVDDTDRLLFADYIKDITPILLAAGLVRRDRKLSNKI